MTLKRILATVSLMGLALSVTGCFCLPGPTPFGLRRERVVVGEGFLVKEALYSPARDPDAGPREVTRVAGDSDSDTPTVSDLDSVSPLDLISLRTRLARSTHMGSVLVDIDRDGTSETLRLGGGFSDVVLIDSSGVEVWRKPGGWSGDFTANGMAYADLDRDGEDEFYVAGRDGLYCFDARGVERWKVGDGIHWHVAVYDPSDVEHARIVSYVTRHRKRTTLEFRDARGLLLHQALSPSMSAGFELLQWPSGPDRLRILARSASSVMLLDHLGRMVWKRRFARGLGMSGSRLSGTLVRFCDCHPPYLAVLFGTRAGWNRSLLCVFTLDGELKYQEVLDSTRSLRGLVAVRIPGSDAGGESLVTGGKDGQVIAYHATPDH
jgi:hypothetical protein